MCDLISGMATALVDQPEKVRVEAESFDSETVIRLYVAEDDLGKLIGKQGRTARSLRTILGAAGSKLQHRFSLDVKSE
ncbi:KH domain-containing protein [Terriglobus roseus]|nr:KH domain-containing protein [Terriglobus roseus]